MYYYIKSPVSGWHEANREYYREYIAYSMRGISNRAQAEAITTRARQSEHPLTLPELMEGAYCDD